MRNRLARLEAAAPLTFDEQMRALAARLRAVRPEFAGQPDEEIALRTLSTAVDLAELGIRDEESHLLLAGDAGG